MENIIQSAIFYVYPTFKVELLALLPAIALFLIGFKVENHYVSKLTFFLNSVTLMSYFGLKQEINSLLGLIVLIFFCLTTWSFLSYAFGFPEIKKYEDLIKNNPKIMKFGGSLVVGIVIILDYFF